MLDVFGIIVVFVCSLAIVLTGELTKRARGKKGVAGGTGDFVGSDDDDDAYCDEISQRAAGQRPPKRQNDNTKNVLLLQVLI